MNDVLQPLYDQIYEDEYNGSLVIIGLNDVGPARLPVLVDKNNLTSIYGSSGSLAKACSEALNVLQSVIAIRLNGQHAFTSVLDASENEVLRIYSISTSSTYNGSYVTVEADTQIEISLYHTNGTLDSAFALDSTKLVSDLVDLINQNARHGNSDFVAECISDVALSTLATGTSELLNGDDETSISLDLISLYSDSIYESLTYIDFRVLCDMTFNYFDQTSDDTYLYSKLYDLCANKAIENAPIIAVIPASDFDGVSGQAYLDNVVASYPGTAINYSKYISVVTGTYTKAMDSSTYRAAPIVAAMIANLSTGQSPIDTIPGANITNSFSNTIVQQLLNYGIISLCETIRRGVLLSADICSNVAFSIKDILMSNDVTRAVLHVIGVNKGDAMPIAENSLDKKIESIFTYMISNSIISDYQYTVEIDKQAGSISISIILIPFGTVQQVRTTLKAGL